MTDAATPLKLYTDTHIAKAVAVQLRSRGVDVVRCEEVGMAEASDLEHLAYATKEGRTVVSHDIDFIRYHHEWQKTEKEHAGIMFCLKHLQGKEYKGVIVREIMVYYELIAVGAGTVEQDIANHIFYIS